MEVTNVAGMLDKVKKSLGITGEYQDDTLTEYINEVKEYLIDSGVSEAIVNSNVSAGVISRGVSDLWNYGAGKLSDYFYQRASQLVYAMESGKYITICAGDYGQSYPVNIEGLEINETDTITFTCDELVKEYTGITNNCVVITFTENESENLQNGTYTWTLKVTKDTAVITAVNDGVLIVT